MSQATELRIRELEAATAKLIADLQARVARLERCVTERTDNPIDTVPPKPAFLKAGSARGKGKKRAG